MGKWRGRFLKHRLDGLVDEPRPGVPRRIGDADVERVITMTHESTPKDATHWSNRSMSKAAGVSPTTVRRICHDFALQPHRVDTFKLSNDPLFVEKVRDIVGLYLDPPERAMVLCVDEKAQMEALDRTQRRLPMTPGQCERCTHDYVRSLQVGAGLGAPAPRPALEDVPMVKEPIEQGGHGGVVSQQLPPVVDGPV